MEYRAKKSIAAWSGLFWGILIFGFLLWGIGYSLGPEDQTLKIMLYIPIFIVLTGFVYMLVGAFNLSYESADHHLVINWGLSSIRIPWEAINEVKEIKGECNMYSILGASWPGYIAGLYQVKGVGPVRMYGTKHKEGFVYIKSDRGFFGLTPEDPEFIKEIARHSGQDIEEVDMEKMPEEIVGIPSGKDRFYRLLLRTNILFLAVYAIYLALCFPGSGAEEFIILLLVLAVALFFFNLGNANRLYQFSPSGGYFLLVLGIGVTGIFLILSLSSISLK